MIEGMRNRHLDFLGQNIICQFKNEKLKLELKQCAKEIGCHIWEAEPGSCDIVAIPAMISIIDRRTVGKDAWNIYMKACKDGMDDPPCLIIDSLKN